MAKNLAATLAIALAAMPIQASACSVVMTREPTYREQMTHARKTVEQASLIIDGEVIEPARRNPDSSIIPARVKVYRVFKGSVSENVWIGEETSCDIFLDQPGERMRLLLFGGPDVYTTWVDYSNARAIDRILKSDRRKDWPLNPR